MTTFNDIYQYVINDISSLEVTPLSSIFKLCLSMLLGAIVGYERKRKGQTAGVRTFSLIAMGATLAMILSIYVPQEYLGLKNGDPGRIAAQVVTGVGFLGAGAIMQMKGSVRGLTTAAGIWMIAAIGMAVGVGMYITSIVATLLILFILVQLERFEHRLSMGSESRIIRLKIKGVLHDIAPYRKVFSRYNIHISNYFMQCDYEADLTTINFIVLAKESVDYLSLFDTLRQIEPTLTVTLANQVDI